jgi:hypothetical protein
LGGHNEVARPGREVGFSLQHLSMGTALLTRVFVVGMTKCPKCGGRLRLGAAITDTALVRRYLDHMGLPSEIPTFTSARAPPQLDFDW